MNKFLLFPLLCTMCISCDNMMSNSSCQNSQPSECNSVNADTIITMKVKKALMSDQSLSTDAKLVSVTTNNGAVTLKGKVASKEEMYNVIRIAKTIDGVTHVDNELMVSET